MHLRVINPTISAEREARTRTFFTETAAPGTRVTVATLPAGVATIGSRRDEALVTPWVLRAAQEAAADGCDAILIDDMLDPGAHAAREIVDIPVLGLAEASMHLAATLGHRFGVVTIAANPHSVMTEQAHRFGVESKLVSVRSLDTPTRDLETDPAAVFRTIVRCARGAVELDRAEVLILDCAGSAAQAAAVQAALVAEGIDVPVIHPSAAALRMLESIVEMGLRASRRTFARRPGVTSSWPEPAEAGDARPMV